MGPIFWASIIIGFFLVMFIIGLALQKKATSSFDSFGKANSRLGAIVITLMSVGAMIGGGGLIGLSTYCYEGGLAEYWTYAMAYLGMIPWILLFVRRIRILNIYTAPDILAMRFPDGGGVIKYPAAIFYIIRGASLLAMQLNALAFLFTAFFGFGHASGVIVSALMVVLYTVTAGYMSVAVTNMIQSIFQTLAPILAIIFVLWAIGGYAPVQEHYASLGTPEYADLFGGLSGGEFAKFFLTEFFTVGLYYFIGDQFDYQRATASKTDKIARNGILIGVLIATPCLLIPSYLGVSASIFLPEGFDASLLFYEVVKAAPPILAAVLLVGALSTIMSATSSYMFGSAMNAAHDLISHHMIRTGKKLDDSKQVLYTRIGVVISALLGIGIAILMPNIIQVWLAGLAICTGGLFVPFLGAWFSKKMNTASAIASMITGSITSFVWWTLLENPYGIHGIWLGIGVSLVTAIVVRAFTKAPLENDINETYYFSEKFTSVIEAEKKNKAK